VIDVNLAATVDVTLQIGATAQTITVTAETPLLETSTSSLGKDFLGGFRHAAI
jgi:hypothetical protein